jgi:dolichol kinase
MGDSLGCVKGRWIVYGGIRVLQDRKSVWGSTFNPSCSFFFFFFWMIRPSPSSKQLMISS